MTTSYLAIRARRCGNCAFFVRIKDWGGSRNGLCDKFDYNVHSDGAYAKSCKSYKSIKYTRAESKLTDLRNQVKELKEQVK